MCLPIAAAGLAAAGSAGTAAATSATFLGMSASTWGAISTAATIGGTVLSAASAYQTNKAQQAQLNMQADAAARDAVNADAQARRAGERGDQEAREIGRRQAAVRGEQKARLAANGLDIGYGSAAATLEQTDYYGGQDQATVARNALDEDYAHRDRAQQLRTTGAYTARQAGGMNPWMSTGGTLLAGAGKVAERWSNWR